MSLNLAEAGPVTILAMKMSLQQLRQRRTIVNAAIDAVTALIVVESQWPESEVAALRDSCSADATNESPATDEATA